MSRITMVTIANVLSEMEELHFRDNRISRLETKLLGLIEAQYGKQNGMYKHFLLLTRQGFWRPENGDPRGSATCINRYQKEYLKHISQYRTLIQVMEERKQLLISR